MTEQTNREKLREHLYPIIVKAVGEMSPSHFAPVWLCNQTIDAILDLPGIKAALAGPSAPSPDRFNEGVEAAAICLANDLPDNIFEAKSAVERIRALKTERSAPDRSTRDGIDAEYRFLEAERPAPEPLRSQVGRCAECRDAGWCTGLCRCWCHKQPTPAPATALQTGLAPENHWFYIGGFRFCRMLRGVVCMQKAVGPIDKPAHWETVAGFEPAAWAAIISNVAEGYVDGYKFDAALKLHNGIPNQRLDTVASAVQRQHEPNQSCWCHPVQHKDDPLVWVHNFIQ